MYMKKYNNIKSFDTVSIKNIEENEVRSEELTTYNYEFENLNNINIHNKKKEYK